MVPINLWEPCCSAKVPDDSQTYTLDVLWLEEEGGGGGGGGGGWGGQDWSWVRFPNNLWVQLAWAKREISLRVLWSKIMPQTSKLYVTEKYIEHKFRPNKHNAEPPLPHLLSALGSPYGALQKKCSVSSAASLRGLSIKSPPSRFPSRSLYEEREAPFPNRSLTCLT